MSKVKLGLSKLSLAEKIEFATRVGGALLENEPTFPEPPVAGADLQDLAAALQDAAANAESTRTALRENLTRQRAAEAALTNDARYVQQISAGNANIIALAAMDVAKDRGPVMAVSAPTHLSARPGFFSGEIILRFRPVKGAYSYLAEVRADAEPKA